MGQIRCPGGPEVPGGHPAGALRVQTGPGPGHLGGRGGGAEGPADGRGRGVGRGGRPAPPHRHPPDDAGTVDPGGEPHQHQHGGGGEGALGQSHPHQPLPNIDVFCKLFYLENFVSVTASRGS